MYLLYKEQANEVKTEINIKTNSNKGNDSYCM
jgi:hypothetical protein